MGFNRFKADTISGASEVLFQTADYWLEEIQSLQPSSLRRGLTAIRHRGAFIIRLYPRMAPMFHLVNNVLLAAATATSIDELVEQSQHAIERSLLRSRNAIANVLPHAKDFIKPGMTLFTYSRSGAVLSTLKQLCACGVKIKIIVTEARPMYEGVRVAKELLDENIKVTLMVDAAMQQAVRECDLVVIGADTFSETQVINKIGTHAIALLARDAQKPVFCFTTTDKYLPPDFNQPEEKDHDRYEVLPGAPIELDIRNTYFESTPLPLITDIITENGPFKPAPVSLLLDLPIDAWLREQF